VSSSTRRHTRSKRDWSSDVCSSDLSAEGVSGLPVEPAVVFEPLADPGGDDLGTEVGAVAGGIPGGEDMTEVGGAVSRRHERGEPGGGEDLGFEGEHIGDVLSGFE